MVVMDDRFLPKFHKLTCFNCRRKKSKCDGNTICSNCKRLKISCKYDKSASVTYVRHLERKISYLSSKLELNLDQLNDEVSGEKALNSDSFPSNAIVYKHSAIFEKTNQVYSGSSYRHSHVDGQIISNLAHGSGDDDEDDDDDEIHAKLELDYHDQPSIHPSLLEPAFDPILHGFPLYFPLENPDLSPLLQTPMSKFVLKMMDISSQEPIPVLTSVFPHYYSFSLGNEAEVLNSLLESMASAMSMNFESAWLWHFHSVMPLPENSRLRWSVYLWDKVLCSILDKPCLDIKPPSMFTSDGFDKRGIVDMPCISILCQLSLVAQDVISQHRLATSARKKCLDVCGSIQQDIVRIFNVDFKCGEVDITSKIDSNLELQFLFYPIVFLMVLKVVLMLQELDSVTDTKIWNDFNSSLRYVIQLLKWSDSGICKIWKYWAFKMLTFHIHQFLKSSKSVKNFVKLSSSLTDDTESEYESDLELGNINMTNDFVVSSVYFSLETSLEKLNRLSSPNEDLKMLCLFYNFGKFTLLTCYNHDISSLMQKPPKIISVLDRQQRGKNHDGDFDPRLTHSHIHKIFESRSSMSMSVNNTNVSRSSHSQSVGSASHSVSGSESHLVNWNEEERLSQQLTQLVQSETQRERTVSTPATSNYSMVTQEYQVLHQQPTFPFTYHYPPPPF